MLAFDAAVPPCLDLGGDLLVEVGHRARAHPRAPEYLGNVLHSPDRNARQVHLDQRQTFETAIIERYRRRESSVEEAGS